jgi:4-amino-4-deoxy-L-arabinose transferase-like glycosyltransferase
MIDLISRYKTGILFALLLILVYFPVFLHLDYMPIRIWDESIMGINAVEMNHNHNYIVTYFNDTPEMSNTKPPLLIWCIVLFSKIFGFSELSLRLPSALAALALCIFLFLALSRYTGSSVYGFFVVCVLVTCQGYIRNHVTRTGEYDSLLVLFSTVSAIQLFLATEAVQKRDQSKYLFLFFVFLTLAVLTKGVACMMQAPGLFLYVLIRKRVIAFLKNRAFYAGLIFFMVFGIGYYFLRESVNPGYLKAVWENELGGRFAGSLDEHHGPFFLYLSEIISWKFVNYYPMFPVAVIIGLRFVETPIRRLVSFALIIGASFLFFVSLAGTKLSHYDAPLFPYLAIITASIFYFIFIIINEWLKQRVALFISGILAFIIMLSFVAKPYSDIIEKVYFPKGDWWEEEFSSNCRFFQAIEKNKEKLCSNKLVYNNTYLCYGSMTVVACYKEILHENGVGINITDAASVNVNDSILLFEGWNTPQQLEQRFNIQTIRHFDDYHLNFIRVTEKMDGH